MNSRILAVALIAFASCKSTNNAASTRISTAPMSNDPSTHMPGTGDHPPYVPATQRDSAHVIASDSTQHLKLDTLSSR